MTCRICLGGQDGVYAAFGTLIQPCKCTGEIKFVHRQCIDQWRLRGSGDSLTHCGVCLAAYIVREEQVPTNAVRNECVIILKEVGLVLLGIATAVFVGVYPALKWPTLLEVLDRSHLAEEGSILTWRDRLLLGGCYSLLVTGCIAIIVSIGIFLHECFNDDRHDSPTKPCPHRAHHFDARHYRFYHDRYAANNVYATTYHYNVCPCPNINIGGCSAGGGGGSSKKDGGCAAICIGILIFGVAFVLYGLFAWLGVIYERYRLAKLRAFITRQVLVDRSTE